MREPGTVGDALARLMASFDERDRAAAEERGMTLEAYCEWARAEEERAEAEKRAEVDRRAEAKRRTGWIRWAKDYLPERSCAELYDGKSQHTDAIRHVKAWLESETPCLILCGGVGTGKTHAAMWAARERWGEFVPAQHLARRVDPWKHELETTEVLRLDASLVVLDDLGAEADEPRLHQALFALVNARNASDRRTLVTTNLAIPQIRPRYGDRIADRLNAMAKAMQLKGASLRRQGAGL
jgi:DNA replication protein DnaC